MRTLLGLNIDSILIIWHEQEALKYSGRVFLEIRESLINQTHL